MKTSNVSIVDLSDGRQVCLSYGVPVAAFIPYDYYSATHETGDPKGYIKTERKWSVTSSKHANAFCGPDAKIVDDVTFCQLIAPIAAKGRD